MTDPNSSNSSPNSTPNTDLINRLTVPSTTPQSGGINLDTPVTVNGKAYTVKQLADLAERAPVADSMRDAVTKIFRDEDPNNRSLALDSLLRAAGFSDAERAQHLAEFNEGGDPGDEDPRSQTPRTNTRRGGAPDKPAMDPLVARMLEVYQKDRDENFNNTIEIQVEKALNDPNGLGGAHQKRVESVWGKERATESQKVFRERIKDDAMRLAQAKLSAGKTLTNADIVAAVDEAAKRVYSIVGAAIPDPSLIGRSGETDSNDILAGYAPAEIPPLKPDASPVQRANHYSARAKTSLLEAIQAARKEYAESDEF